MNKKIDISNYKKIINEIHANFLLLKEDKENQELYLKLKDSLSKLRELIDKHQIPSDLYYRSEKYYYDYYRLMEVTYIKKEEKKK